MIETVRRTRTVIERNEKLLLINKDVIMGGESRPARIGQKKGPT